MSDERSRRRGVRAVVSLGTGQVCLLLLLAGGPLATFGAGEAAAQDGARFTWDDYVRYEQRTRNMRQQRSRFECVAPGSRPVSRVVGGIPAPAGMAPWQVSLQSPLVRRPFLWRVVDFPVLGADGGPLFLRFAGR